MTKSSNAPASNLPDFEAGKSYDVSLAEAVEYPTGSGNWMRPGQKVTMDGALAAELKGKILAAGNATEA
jgi:hypothetical protein